MLLDAGADINKLGRVDITLETSLTAAISSANQTVIKYLVDSGVNIEKPNGKGLTPLKAALNSCDCKVLLGLMGLTFETVAAKLPADKRIEKAAAKFFLWMQQFKKLHTTMGHDFNHNKALVDFLIYNSGFRYIKDYDELCNLADLVNQHDNHNVTNPPCSTDEYNGALKKAVPASYGDVKPTQAKPTKLSTLCYFTLFSAENKTAPALEVTEQQGNLITHIENRLKRIGLLPPKPSKS